ncbi:MAG: hypothetical protein FJX77_11975, partial [Armatimonadetes bacterium]|nr:hypothetical protein [Armatimonadota bacterium]
MPERWPAWMLRGAKDERFYRRGSYNFAVDRLPPLSRDLNGVAVGHALAYEALVTGREAQLETTVFGQIDRVLKRPPRWMPDEDTLSTTFSRRYGLLQKVFDGTHLLHAQTVDVLASRSLSLDEKEREIETLWRFYQGSPYAVTGLPLNME